VCDHIDAMSTHAHAPPPAASPDRAGRIEAALRQHLNPTTLVVDDDSAKHAGHAGAAPGGQTHYSVAVVSAVFTGQSRVARSRLVHALLQDEFASGMHALALTLRTPEEYIVPPA
jgi:BolA protein